MAVPLRPHLSPRHLIGELLTSLAIGLSIGSLIAVAVPNAPRDIRLVSIAFAGLVGLGIASLANLITWSFRGRLERLTGMRKAAARTIQLFVSGVGAWLFAGLIVQSLFPRFRAIDVRAYPYVLATAGLAIVIGFVFISFDVLRKRLAASVARVKETEFAERELQLARDLQSRLLPPAEIQGEGYRVAARNLAARVVAGDFYDVFRLADGAVGLTVADVAGKGMAASLIMASAKARLSLLAADRPAEETLRELNRVLAAELSAREFVALVFARYDPASGTVTLANAGLPDPYLIRKGEPPSPLAVNGPRLPLGVRREVAYEAIQLRLEPGDRLLLLTDGLAEAPTPAGEPLGYAALAGLMAGDGDAASPLVWLDGVLERVRQATAPALEDDWTALVLERT
ncbi:MAG TPA: SpoIIE family protein phosphatase [Thermoanaerobaculia bacterium]|nr:SpoIIE family protein phosphatase [Thermoanaerobaculia bacterium]